jgi:putative toxin-antitoxin system antitoxin component (TIGR02293 family)
VASKSTKALHRKTKRLSGVAKLSVAGKIAGAPRRVRPASTEATDTAGRVVRISKLAEQIFGDEAKAARWLGKPKVALSGKAPLNCLGDEEGERIVKEMLYRIDSGIPT